MGRMRLLSQNSDTENSSTIEGFCIIKSILVKTNSKGSSYLDMVLQDCEGEIEAKLWDYSTEQHGVFEQDQIIKVRGVINIWKDAEQFKIDRIRPTKEGDDINMALLVPCAPFDPDWMFDEIMGTAAAFADDDLRRLTQYMLRENKDILLSAPAAVKLHHATRGGLLHHIYSILQAAKAICTLYPALDEQLVYAGVILHDIAKLEELEIGKLGLAGGYTPAGQLVGHIALGVAAVAKAGALLDIPAETTTLVQHMLLSHHGVPEFGSPRPPMFPEAEVIAQLDLLDARMYEMFDALASVPIGSFSERLWALENRQLYQHGHAFHNADKS